METDDQLVPLRLLESLTFCPRQAWYHFVAGYDRLNIHMERGLDRHSTFDAAEVPGTTTYRSVAVQAPLLGVRGVLDEVRIDDRGLTITEVKTTRLVRSIWSGIVLQLGGQRLALEEHIARGGWFGPEPPPSERWHLRVYFTASHSYRDVAWTDELDHDVRAAVTHARQVLVAKTPPAGNIDRRCWECQLMEDCMPFDLATIKEAIG